MTACHEIYALRYATLQRQRRDNFMFADPHDGPMPMDYFVWVVRGSGRSWLVDTGFGEAAAAARKRTLLRDPIGAVGRLGIEAHAIDHVIVTHLHYDHAGNLHRLPQARLHLQEAELQFATGRYMQHDRMRHAYDVDDVLNVVRGVYDRRVDFHDGDVELADGLQLVRLGGHTAGLQAVRVHTARGWVVLASDATHYYANLHRASPFPIAFHVGDVLDGYKRLLALAESPDHVVPGHDPLVLKRYPRHGAAGDDIVRLHEAPLEPLPDSW